ncbi:MAG TPA: thioredoxin family protein [Chthoniobacterales bacterium]
MNTQTTTFEDRKHTPAHPIVSPEEWLAARKELLSKEKEFTRFRDRLTAERRELPWVRVEKNYIFDGPEGRVTLADLFEGRSQLIVYHFMFGPGWEEGCVGCSFLADHLEGALMHLQHHDVSLAVVSRAPLREIEAFKRRMEWDFKWVSSFWSDFNFDFYVSFTKEEAAKGKVYYNYALRDFQVEELSGTSVFYRDEHGEIFHTYSAYARGDEQLLGAYHFLELTPKGRNETGPSFDLTDWVRHHDRYGAGGSVDSTGRYVAAKESDACCHSEIGRA